MSTELQLDLFPELLIGIEYGEDGFPIFLLSKSFSKIYAFPDWAEFIAKDSSGLVYVYEKIPNLSRSGTYWPDSIATDRFTYIKITGNLIECNVIYRIKREV